MVLYDTILNACRAGAVESDTKCKFFAGGMTGRFLAQSAFSFIDCIFFIQVFCHGE